MAGVGGEGKRWGARLVMQGLANDILCPNLADEW